MDLLKCGFIVIELQASRGSKWYNKCFRLFFKSPNLTTIINLHSFIKAAVRVKIFLTVWLICLSVPVLWYPLVSPGVVPAAFRPVSDGEQGRNSGAAGRRGLVRSAHTSSAKQHRHTQRPLGHRLGGFAQRAQGYLTTFFKCCVAKNQSVFVIAAAHGCGDTL